MPRNKKQPDPTEPATIAYQTQAEPKAMADGVPVFCAHDSIVPLERLVPNPRNPNKHPPEQIRALGAIIRATGWRGSITVSTRSGFIVKGHGRLLAAQLEDLAEAPVDFQNYGSEAEEYADLIADNRLAELSETDSKLLADLMAEVDTGAAPFELTGYTEEEYGKLVTALSEADHTKDEEAEAEEAKCFTRRGDLWIAGGAVLMCGDCSDPDDVDALLAGAGGDAEIALSVPGRWAVAVSETAGTCYVMERDPANVDAAMAQHIKRAGPDGVRCIRQGEELPPEAVARIFAGLDDNPA